MKRLSLTLGVASAFLATLAAPAHAGQVSLQSGVLAFTPAPGQSERIEVRIANGDPTRIEVAPLVLGGETVGAGAGCTAGIFGEASCPRTGLTFITVGLGDGDDNVVFRIEDPLVARSAFGGSGNDRLDGSGGADVLDGGAGDDDVRGSGGADHVLGGEGNDHLQGGSGVDVVRGQGGDDGLFEHDDDGSPDDLFGEAGFDEVSYASTTIRTDDLSLSNDGQANDGAAGEQDTIGVDVEALTGGFGNDVITGGAGAERLSGGQGGADTITGGTGTDVLLAGPGPDTVYARDGAVDDVVCGLHELSQDIDVVEADADDMTTDCEEVRRPAGAPTATPQPAPATSGPQGGAAPTLGSLALAGQRLRTALRRGLALTFTVDQPGTAVATLLMPRAAARRLGVAAAREVVVARGRRSVETAGRGRVVVRFTPRARRRLLRARLTRFRLELRFTNGAGQLSRISRLVRLRR